MKIFKFLENTSTPLIVLLGLLQIAILGILDYSTGFEVSFAVFYLLPVTFVAWYCPRNYAIFVSFVSATAWHFSNSLAGEHFSNELIPFWNALTRLSFFIVVAVLLSKLKDALEHAVKIAGTDFLTGALNPRKFYDLVNMEISRSVRYRRNFTIIYLDADNFKMINDTLGHHTGSELLIRVVTMMKKRLRSTDFVGRLGGDEFAVLLPETDRCQAEIVVDKLQRSLLEEMQSENWKVTFSIGVLTCNDSPESVDEIIKLADNLMYEVKKNGKNSAKFDEYTNQDSLAKLKETVSFA